MVAASTLSSREAVMHAKTMFQHVLSGWASDVLSLRRKNLDRPSVRRCQRGDAAHTARTTRRMSGRRRAA